MLREGTQRPEDDVALQSWVALTIHFVALEDYVAAAEAYGNALAFAADPAPSQLFAYADVLGLAVPGMPIGSPGMEGPNPRAYRVIAFAGAGKTEDFAFHGSEEARPYRP